MAFNAILIHLVLLNGASSGIEIMLFCHAGFHRIGNISKLPLYKSYGSQGPHDQGKGEAVK